MNQRKVRSYDKEFKQNAVNHFLRNNASCDKVGEELGVPASTLTSWVAAHRKNGLEAFPGKGKTIRRSICAELRSASTIPGRTGRSAWRTGFGAQHHCAMEHDLYGCRSGSAPSGRISSARRGCCPIITTHLRPH